jgi:S-adenosylmethionine:tRNA-ribosyltransferase-isomerase (queuine synthetase)
MNDLSNITITKEEGKRERKHNAVKLPASLDQSSIPIYVNYYKECYDQKNKCYREYFKIEKHPHNIHNKLYVSSKSNKINILEKLEEIKKMLLIIEEEYEHYKKNNETKQVIKSNEEFIKSDAEFIKSEQPQSVSNILQNNKNSILLPKYISIRKHESQANKYYLIYDKKSGSKRNTLKALCSTSTLLKTNLELFITKIEEKFAT